MVSGDFNQDQLDKFINKESVEQWMTPNPYTIQPFNTLKQAARLMETNHIDGLPVIDEDHRVIGLITKSRLMKCYVEEIPPSSPVSQVYTRSVITIGTEDTLSYASRIPVGRLPVVNKRGILVGILTRSDILRAYSNDLASMKESINAAETLSSILESAYEGIAVIDTDGIIREFNRAYCRFLGKVREEVIGKHVTEIIENTRMHLVVKSGIPERGYIQRIQGHNMVVHRIPIWKDGKVVGAIGMLIFEGVTELYDILGKMQELSRQVHKNVLPEERTDQDFDQIIGQSEEMLSLKATARKAAATPSTILITGESGTGKELVARAVHQASAYSEGPFVSVNCAAIPEHLLEAELFGYEEGAFTGARKGGKPGKFDLANRGTLFLDEIGDMPPLMQSKILRALEDRQIESVGGVKKHHVDVRIIAATNRPLEDMVKEGTFREDLYYRLNIIRLRIPPLRERKNDIPVLLSHHLQGFCKRFGIVTKFFSPAAIAILEDYEWPGNVRELVNVVEMLVGLVDALEIDAKDIPAHIRQKRTVEGNQLSEPRAANPAQNQGMSLTHVKSKVQEQEKGVILEVLLRVNGNKAAAARELGIQRSTLYEKLKKYGLM